ncbi:unnamed protein product [Allacma fusca]|uniref:Uncharacterized protein n=1 Tax=Allacma fusca TaxID=39272 RepID=A0A8J2KCH1_9HEXA|nr:unnamed protein product [Allacma fusca]
MDRVIIGGSMGKRTAISIEDISEAGYCTPPDLDIVVFLNYKKPPFRQVLDEFMEAFREVDNVVVSYSWDEHFICIDYKGYKIDITPSTNLRNGMLQNLLELRSGDTQKVKIMEIITNANYDQKTIRAYSSGLAEYAVGFMKNESAFAHALIRLTIFWNSQIQMSGYVLFWQDPI